MAIEGLQQAREEFEAALAAAGSDAGRIEEAESLFRRAREIRERNGESPAV